MTKSQATTLKKLLREIVILRDGEKCAKCGKQGVLHLSHVKSEGAHPRLKFEPVNVKFLCIRCHLYWWHRDITEATEWFNETHPSRAEELKEMVKNEYSMSKPDFKKLKERFEETIYQLKRLNRVYTNSKRYERDSEKN